MSLSLTVNATVQNQSTTNELILDERAVGNRKVIEFPEGLLGFENARRFIIVEREEYAPFQWLVSVNDPTLGFVIIDPSYFYPDYLPKVDERELKNILGENGRTLLVYTIVTVAPDPKAITANLVAPLLLCVETWRGKQVVLNEPRYSTRYRIMRNPSAADSNNHHEAQRTNRVGITPPAER